MFADGDERADEGQLVHHACLAWHVFADLDAGDVGLDGPKFAAIFQGGVGLEIVHVHVGRAAGQVDHDGRFGRCRAGGVFAGLGFEPQHVAERQAAPNAPMARKLRRKGRRRSVVSLRESSAS